MRGVAGGEDEAVAGADAVCCGGFGIRDGERLHAFELRGIDGAFGVDEGRSSGAVGSGEGRAGLEVQAVAELSLHYLVA